MRIPLYIVVSVLCLGSMAMAQSSGGPTTAQLQKENDTLATELAESNARAGKMTQTLLGLRQKAKTLQDKLDRMSVLLEIRTQQRDALTQGKTTTTAPANASKKQTSAGGLSADESLRLLEQMKSNQKELRDLRMSVATQNTAVKLAKVRLAAAEARSETHAANAKKDRQAVDHVRQELDAARSEASLNQNLAAKANTNLVAALELLTAARKEIRRLKAQLADRKNPQPKIPEIPQLVTASPSLKAGASADPDKRILVTPSAATKTATRKPVVAQAKPISGTIRSISGAVVTVSIGRTAGMKPGTKLIVFRDGTFVGYLLIDRVADTTSTGAMSRTIRKPAAGDTVTDRIDIE
jgi:hypothetical protein